MCVGSPVLRDGVCQRWGLDVPHPEVAALRRGSGAVLRCRNYFSPHVSPWERHHLPVSSAFVASLGLNLTAEVRAGVFLSKKVSLAAHTRNELSAGIAVPPTFPLHIGQGVPLSRRE